MTHGIRFLTLGFLFPWLMSGCLWKKLKLMNPPKIPRFEIGRLIWWWFFVPTFSRCKWPYKRVTGVMTQLMTSRGPPCRWWFQSFLKCSPLGKMNSFLTSICFIFGWKHHLDFSVWQKEKGVISPFWYWIPEASDRWNNMMWCLLVGGWTSSPRNLHVPEKGPCYREVIFDMKEIYCTMCDEIKP